MAQKDMKIALVISLLFSGLGIAYAGNIKRGVGIFAATIILNVLGFTTWHPLSRVATLLWIIGLYLTYKEVNVD